MKKELLNHPGIDVNMISKEISNEQKIEETPLISALAIKNRNIIKKLLSHPKFDVNHIKLERMNPNKKLHYCFMQYIIIV